MTVHFLTSAGEGRGIRNLVQECHSTFEGRGGKHVFSVVWVAGRDGRRHGQCNIVFCITSTQSPPVATKIQYSKHTASAQQPTSLRLPAVLALSRSWQSLFSQLERQSAPRTTKGYFSTRYIGIIPSVCLTPKQNQKK